MRPLQLPQDAVKKNKMDMKNQNMIWILSNNMKRLSTPMVPNDRTLPWNVHCDLVTFLPPNLKYHCQCQKSGFSSPQSSSIFILTNIICFYMCISAYTLNFHNSKTLVLNLFHIINLCEFQSLPRKAYSLGIEGP